MTVKRTIDQVLISPDTKLGDFSNQAQLIMAIKKVDEKVKISRAATLTECRCSGVVLSYAGCCQCEALKVKQDALAELLLACGMLTNLIEELRNIPAEPETTEIDTHA